MGWEPQTQIPLPLYTNLRTKSGYSSFLNKKGRSFSRNFKLKKLDAKLNYIHNRENQTKKLIITGKMI